MIAHWTPAAHRIPATPFPRPRTAPVSLVKRYVYPYDRVLYSTGFKPPTVPRFGTTQEEEGSHCE